MLFQFLASLNLRGSSLALVYGFLHGFSPDADVAFAAVARWQVFNIDTGLTWNRAPQFPRYTINTLHMLVERFAKFFHSLHSASLNPF